MTPYVLIFASAVAVTTLLGALVYRRLWIRLYGSQVTPKGFGAFLAAALLAAAIVFHAPASVVTAFAIISAAAAIYWLDDLRGLSIGLRMGVSFATGVLIGAFLLFGEDALPLWLLVSFCAAAGGLNIVLTNIVNFYDGADLNLATFIGLTAGAILLFAPAFDFMTSSAIACLAFIVPFAVMNSRPHTIYLGDAGSFVFASFLTMVVVIYFSRGELAAQVAIPLALPALDAFYVLCIRIIERHDLLTRNYLHLYQKLNQYHKGFGYLLPQVVNAGLSLACASALQTFGLNQFMAVATAMVIVTVPFYFACRKFLLPRTGPGGGAA